MTCDQVMEYLQHFDGIMARRVLAAKQQNKVLSLMARVCANGQASVGLIPVDASHPFATLRGPTNAVCFYTQRYKDYPLHVHGPAAGPSILASSVFSSLLSLMRELGAKDHVSEEDNLSGKEASSQKTILRISPSQSANDLTNLTL